ncbi:MAG TPA: histidine phosphatase family protein [Acidimicrobiia bacterium]|nr:histidine phosphatase family protein [Acidimicrobiia bacterium]
MTDTEGKRYRQHRYTPPPGATEILLVRHGESQPVDPEQPFELVDGHGDPPLDPVGVEQAERLANRLAGEDIAAIYVTTLRRTVETAAPLAQRLGIEPRVEPNLREVYLGEWEGGLLRVKAEERDPAFVRAIEEERWDPIPGAEPVDVFRDRVQAGIARVARAHRDELVVVVTHGGVIGQVLAGATDARGFAFIGADNASISHIVVDGDRIVVRRFNDTTHLEPHFSVAAPPPI